MIRQNDAQIYILNDRLTFVIYIQFVCMSINTIPMIYKIEPIAKQTSLQKDHRTNNWAIRFTSMLRFSTLFSP